MSRTYKDSSYNRRSLQERDSRISARRESKDKPVRFDAYRIPFNARGGK